MKTETEMAVRSIVATDPNVTNEMLEHAIDILRGRIDGDEGLIHTIKIKDAAELLQVEPRTVVYYLDMGYLDRVYGCKSRAIGLSRESLMRFMTRRVVKHRDKRKRTNDVVKFGSSGFNAMSIAGRQHG